MKPYKAICLIAFLFSGITLFSQNQTITLKDGTVYEGYISEQDYTTGLGRIVYSRMTKTFLSEDVQGTRTEKKTFGELSKEWQDWAIENNKVETQGKDKFVSLTNMTVKGQSRDYYILVNGAKYLTAFTISEGTEPCRMSEIASIRKPERDNTLLTDVDDIVQTDNATYTGIILEQIPGVSFTVWNESDHTVHLVDYADVRSVGKDRFNRDYSLWNQTPYLERVKLKNETSSGEGLVIENSFGDDMNILFAEKNGDGMDTRQYKYGDIVSIQRFCNPDYKPIYDIVLNEGESRINRDSTLLKVEMIQLMSKDSGKFFVIDPGKMGLVAKVRKKDVFIETNTSGVSDIYIAKALLFKNMPASVLPAEDKKDARPSEKRPKINKKKDKAEKTIDLYGYTYATLFESEIYAESVTSINGTTKISFTLPEPGIYFIYLRRNGTCWALDYRPE